ncbi:MAG TPA: glycosyltransferase family 87 protein [Gemmataceae bacterium]|nr:glycosyltransferase family 87 protein [Gemmataceae bacterium]
MYWLGVLACGGIWILAYLYFDGGKGRKRSADLIALVCESKKPCCDFFQNWAAVVDWSQGRSLYTPLRENFERFEPRLGNVYTVAEKPPPTRPGLGSQTAIPMNAHPPFTSLLVLPLVGKPFSAAMEMWTWLNVVFLLATAVLLVGGADLPEGNEWLRWPLLAIFAAIGLSSLPMWQQFAEGNWNIVLLLLLTASWRLNRSGRPIGGGIAIGLAALIKLYPMFLAVYFLFRKQWKGLAACCGTFAIGTVITIAVFDWHDHVYYVMNVLPSLKFQVPLGNVSLLAVVGRLFDPDQQSVAPLVNSKAYYKIYLLLSFSVLAAVLVSPILWAVVKRNLTCQPDALFAALAMGSLLFSPVTWFHNLVQVALPCWLLAIESLRRQSIGLLFILTLSSFTLWIGNIRFKSFLYENHIYVPYEIVTFAAAATYAMIAIYLAACNATLRNAAAEKRLNNSL